MSQSYEEHINSLPRLDSLTDLLLPPRTHPLLYGPSFLGQLADGLICAARVEGRLINSQAFDYPTKVATTLPPPPLTAPPPPPPHWMPPGRVLQASYKCCDGGVGEQARSGQLITYNFAHNSSLTLAINYSPLQRTDEAKRHLSGFVRQHRFTHLVYMQPHPDCFFLRQAMASNSNKKPPKCVDLAAGAETDATSTTVPIQWRILANTHIIRHSFLAFAWKAWKPEAQQAMWNRSSAYNVPRARVLTPEPIVASPCLMPGCDKRSPSGLGGHQCLPGAATLASRDIARAVRRTRKE